METTAGPRTAAGSSRTFRARGRSSCRPAGQRRCRPASGSPFRSSSPVHADGIVEDVDGNRLIDFGSGISVTNVGNSAPRVVAAVTEQVQRFTHTCFQVTPYESYVEVCEALNELTPGDHAKRSFLVNSGAEAVENAVKVARYATGRPGGRVVRPRLPRSHAAWA